MKLFDWNSEKNQHLKVERNVCFEDVILAIKENRLLDVLEHSNKKQYPGQKMFIIEINYYVYIVPFAEDERTVFLKTIIPSRKATKKYIINR